MLEECSLIIVLIHIKWYSVTEWSRHKVQKKSFLFFFFLEEVGLKWELHALRGREDYESGKTKRNDFWCDDYRGWREIHVAAGTKSCLVNV